MKSAKKLLARILFSAGILGVYHRVRNRDALTVISLHRILAEDDPRWQTSDPLYTLSDRMFRECLKFFVSHYSVISLDDLERARSNGSKLPPRPLLITFDDGWADNFDYALRELRSFGLPAAIFVAADAIDRHEAFFQERLISAWRSGRFGSAELGKLWSRLEPEVQVPSDVCAEGEVRALIARLHAIPAASRDAILVDFAATLADDARQMLTSGELRELQNNGFAIGTHGKRHEPLTRVPDLDSELVDSKNQVAQMLGVDPSSIRSMSFPFSKQNASVVQRAKAAGYQLLFGGGLTLNPCRGAVPELIARVGVTAREVCDGSGNLRPYLLALDLFRRPHRQLEPA